MSYLQTVTHCCDPAGTGTDAPPSHSENSGSFCRARVEACDPQLRGLGSQEHRTACAAHALCYFYADGPSTSAADVSTSAVPYAASALHCS